MNCMRQLKRRLEQKSRLELRIRLVPKRRVVQKLRIAMKNRVVLKRRQLGAPESGSATVELAITLSAIVLTLVFVLSLVSLGLARAHLQESARQGARLASLGPAGIEQAHALEEQDVTMRVTQRDEWVTATASTSMRILGLTVASIRLSESATAYSEQSLGSPDFE